MARVLVAEPPRAANYQQLVEFLRDSDDAAPMLSLPGLVAGDANLPDGRLLVFAFRQRDAQTLNAIRPCNVTAVAQRAFLVMFAGF